MTLRPPSPEDQALDLECAEILDVLADGIAYFDADGNLAMSNQQYASLLELDAASMITGTAWRTVSGLYRNEGPLPTKPLPGSAPIEVRLGPQNWRRIDWRHMSNGRFIEICSDISALKSRENLLQRHEMVLGTVEKLAHIGYFVMNPETLETTFLSDGILEIAPSLEPSDGQVPYGSLVDRVHPDERDEVAQKTFDAIQNGTSINLEFRALSADGDIQNLWLSNAEIFDADLDQFVRVGLVQDITERVQSEALSQEREALRWAVTESALDCVVTIDAEGKIKEFNPAAERTFGFEKSAVIGKELSETIIPHDLREAHKAGLAHYLKSGEHNVLHQRIEITALHSDGHTFPVELAITPVDVNGMQYFTAYLRDITNRVAAEASLKESERNLKDAQRIAGVGSWEWDTEAGTISWSDELYKIYGVDPKTVTPDATMLGDMIAPDQADEVAAIAMAGLQNGEAYEVDHRIITPTGETKHIRARGEPQVDETGSLIKFVGTVQDFTHLRRVQAELEQAKDEAERASEAKSEFLAMMSHEIRTPMNGVLGTLNLLGQSQLNSEQNALIRLAMSSGETLNLMLSDVLDFSKIEAGRLDLEPVPFRPALLFSDIGEFWRPVVEGKGLTFDLSFAKDIPEVLLGDTGRIRQILNNFLSNAAKFTARGQVKVEVAASALDQDVVELQFSVADTGRGISTADQARVFSEFDQLGAMASDRNGGTGLGLAICRKLSELMKGSVRFESTQGIGSRFICTLPLSKANASQFPKQSASDTEYLAPLTNRLGKAAKVLLAEDNATNQIVAKRMLANMGCHVDLVDDGMQAVEAVSRRDYDVILMDINMPVMDGLETARHLLDRPTGDRTPPMIALTAYAMDQDIKEFNAAGMRGFVAKPIDPTQLHKAMQAALNGEEVSQSAGPAALETDDLIDTDTLNTLLAEFEGAARSRLCASFGNDIAGVISGLEEYLSTGDLQLVERQSHTLKSISGTFGALALQQSAGDVNDTCRSGSNPPEPAEIEELIRLARTTLVVFHSLSEAK